MIAEPHADDPAGNPPSYLVSVEDKKPAHGPAMIDSMIAGTADDPNAPSGDNFGTELVPGMDESLPPNVPLS